MKSHTDVASPTRVLVVDDSAFVRKFLSEIINGSGDMQCVGTAHNPSIARDMLRNLNPDVMTLDVEMPHQNGLDFLEQVMGTRPLPVVMISSLTGQGAHTTLRALELGAVDFLEKPRHAISKNLPTYAEEILRKLRGAAKARVRYSTSQAASKLQPGSPGASTRIVLLGASTGGVEAIRRVLEPLPENAPPIVIVQHMPQGFTGLFADRLDDLCAIHVVEATEGMVARPGGAYIGPPGQHLVIEHSEKGFVIGQRGSDPVSFHCPAVNVLFESGARAAGRRAIGVLLTGMGTDGARGLLELRRAGARTIAQDRDSSVVWGMPGEAVRLGAAGEVLPLDLIARALLAPTGQMLDSTPVV
jgi:two-component system, chemotaxis family, protein-glutamate methylesterase/glutaminase